MKAYSFLLKYRLSSDDRDPDAVVERLGEAGCTDALVGVGIVGRLALDFTREADNAQDAVRSALADVKSAIPSAVLVEAGPDLVGLTDIAELMDVSRQNLRKLMVGHDGFPLPVHEGSVSIWHLSDVLGWLEGRKGYVIEAELRDVAEAACLVNRARDALRRPATDIASLEALVA